MAADDLAGLFEHAGIHVARLTGGGDEKLHERADGNIEGSIRFRMHGLGQREAIPGRHADAEALTCLELAESIDIAAGAETAELVFQPGDLLKGGIRGLCGVGLVHIGLRDDDLEGRRHGMAGMAEGGGHEGVKNGRPCESRP